MDGVCCEAKTCNVSICVQVLYCVCVRVCEHARA